MKIPFSYILRNLGTRRLTTFITVFGIALVAFVFAAVLMMARGIQETLVATGDPANAIVVRKAAQGEISSIIDGTTAGIVRTLPHIARMADGTPVVSGEPVVVINLEKLDGGLSNVIVRGVSPLATTMRPQVRIVEGRMFTFGAREVIAGISVSERFRGARIGDQVKFAGDQWTVVGTFEANSSGFESEMWGDALQLLSAFNRGNSVSSMTVRLEGEERFDDFKRAFEADQRLNQFETKRERQYFEEQSEAMAIFIRIFGVFITVFFSLGSTVGAMITMYAAVANRTVEVGTLRALGFRRRSVLIAFLMESLLIALIGGGVGLAFASVLQLFQISTLNFGSFAELAFSFALTPDIIVITLLFSIGMGFVGGFLPAVRAARLNIVNALRAA
jgi:ABC-type antimicrobial peptide transport system permease subunit